MLSGDFQTVSILIFANMGIISLFQMVATACDVDSKGIDSGEDFRV